MERAMSLAAVPDDGEMYIAGFGMWCPGRQLRAASGVPVVWVSERAIGGLVWGDLAEKSAESGLQPFLLSGMDGDTARPGTPASRSANRRTPGPLTARMLPACWMAGGGVRARRNSRRMRNCGRCSR